jgi:hypothetical protein
MGVGTGADGQVSQAIFNRGGHYAPIHRDTEICKGTQLWRRHSPTGGETAFASMYKPTTPCRRA